MVEDLKIDINVKVEQPKETKKKNKSFSDDVEKSEIEKSKDAEKISKDIMPSVLTNMLMAYPEIAMGVGIGIWSGMTSMFKALFKTDNEEETENNSLNTPDGSGITKPEPFQEPKFENFDFSEPELPTITESSPVSKEKNESKYDIQYDISINYYDNSNTTIEHLKKINETDITSPIKEWKNDFSSTVNDEKNIIRNNLTLPLEELNKVIKRVIDNKNKVDQLNLDIKSYERKIRNKRIENVKKKLHLSPRESSDNDLYKYHKSFYPSQSQIRLDKDHQSTKDNYFKYAYGQSIWNGN